MKNIHLSNYLANVTCPYCQREQPMSTSGPWYGGDTITVYQMCDVCDRAWREEWHLKKVEIAETKEEQEDLDFLFRHPEIAWG